jgi:shikimate dehydrogenase
MKQYGLIGFPLSHSFSKNYFEKKFAAEGITNCTFTNFELKSIEEIEAMLAEQKELHGFAVTIPYKKKILHYLFDATDEVKQMIACNCVKIIGGKLYGYNTDVVGFEQSLVKKLQPHHTQALVLGTGGAAQAVTFVLKKLGIHFLFVSRDGVGKKNTIAYSQITPALLQHNTLIINTTPLGTYPNIQHYPSLPYDALTPKHFLYDLVYNPTQTIFLQKGLQQNATIQNGYDMLVIQAEENWKIWSS